MTDLERQREAEELKISLMALGKNAHWQFVRKHMVDQMILNIENVRVPLAIFDECADKAVEFYARQLAARALDEFCKAIEVTTMPTIDRSADSME